MISLNLPAYRYALKQEIDKWYILDIVYKKYLVLSPEEWVRQHMLNYLIHHLAYPKGLCCTEQKIHGIFRNYRPDIVLWTKSGQARMIIECKAPYIKLTHQSLGQIIQYNRHLSAEFLVLTNGMVHFCWQLDPLSNKFKTLDRIPSYQALKNIE